MELRFNYSWCGSTQINRLTRISI